MSSNLRTAAAALCLCLGTLTAHAEGTEAAPPAQGTASNAPQDAAGMVSAPPAEPVQKADAHVDASLRDRPMVGGTGVLLAGIAGSLVPLLLFALPLIWLPLIPGFGPFVLLGAALWAGLMGSVGGGVVWALLSLFSPSRSGFLIPVLVAGAVTLGLTLAAGLVAAVVLLAGFVGGTLLGGWYMFGLAPPWQSGKGTTNGGAAWWSAVAVAFIIWTSGAIVASIAGPLSAASSFQRGSIPSDDGVHLDVITP
jgi:hypothetical protein